MREQQQRQLLLLLSPEGGDSPPLPPGGETADGLPVHLECLCRKEEPNEEGRKQRRGHPEGDTWRGRPQLRQPYSSSTCRGRHIAANRAADAATVAAVIASVAVAGVSPHLIKQ